MAGSTIRALTVKGNDAKIMNLSIINCKFNGGDGGAIYFSNYGSVEYCNFTNNSANGYAGAVNFKASGTVINCNFINNAGSMGGAVHCVGYCRVLNSNFVNNKATHKYGTGGAIYATGLIENCNFTNNNALDHGGAISCDKNTNIVKCNFINNTAPQGGAYFSNWGGDTVVDCNFTNNRASREGGAAFFSVHGDFKNCNFVDNQAASNGGGLYMAYGNLENCNFTGNIANTGSAIFSESLGTLTVSNSLLLNNKANSNSLQITLNGDKIKIEFRGKDNLLNAIYSDGGVSFTNVTYWGANGIANTGNSPIAPSRSERAAGQNITVVLMVDDVPVLNTVKVTDENGTIVLDTVGVGVYNIAARHDEDSYYTQKEATDTIVITSVELSAHEWAVTATMNSDIVTGNVTFTVTNESGVVKTAEIALKNGVAELELNRLFAGEYNISANYGGAAKYSPCKTNITHVLSITKSTYSNLSEEIGSGGNIELKYDYYTYDFGSPISITDYDSVIDGKGAVIDMAGSDIRALRVFAYGVTVKNLTIKNANYTDKGSAIYFHWLGTVENCSFVNNTVSGDGGAVYFNANGTLTDCSFADNRATAGGAAVYFYSNAKVTNCNFTNNAAMYGGAIVIDDVGAITGSIFTGNHAISSNGGAVWISSGTFENCMFTYNYASKDGGAVRTLGACNLTDCNFANNSVVGDGGAVWISSSVIVANCNFTGNIATNGSAIYFYSSSGTKNISNSLFLNNRANAEAISPLILKKDKTIEITFMGQNNLINAIYSEGDVSFTNVVYWGANGVANTGNSPIVLSMSNREAGQNITVTVLVNNIAVLNTTKVTDENGTIILNQVAGDYKITARHNTDSYYTQAEKTETFNIPGNGAILELNLTGHTITATMTPNTATGNITFTVKNESGVIKTVEIALNNGIAEIDMTGWVGDYNITATYKGDIDFYPCINTIKVSDKVPINVSDILIIYNEIANVAVLVPDAIDGQNITITVNTTSKNATVKNGKAQAEFTGLPAGKYLITVEYLGDGYHLSNSTTAKLTVNKANSTLSIENVVLNYGETTAVTATTGGATGITAKIDDENATIVDNDTILIPVLSAGNYALTVTTVPDENHTEVTKTVNITVNKLNTVITADNKVYVINYGGKYSSTVKDANGKVLSGVKVTFALNGKNLGSATTNANGVATITLTVKMLKTAKAGNRNLVINFAGDANHNMASKTVKITINKEKTKIKAKKKTFKMSKKVKKYAMTLKNSKNKPVKKVKVTLKIKGKTYKAKTNNKGKATFKIKKLTKKGTFRATIKFKGNKYYKKATKKVKIKVR